MSTYEPCLPICAQVDKHRLVHELNIPYRDLRILDPMVATPYPCALLVREKALVVNLEAVRCALVSSLPSVKCYADSSLPAVLC